jgi:hypothetical protein
MSRAVVGATTGRLLPADSAPMHSQFVRAPWGQASVAFGAGRKDRRQRALHLGDEAA